MESKRSVILHWVEQGLIDEGQVTDALRVAGVLPDTRRWQTFLVNLMLWLGGLALVFSLLFFIAYNWDAMGRFARFGLIQLSIIATLGVFWKYGGEHIVSQISLVMASILVGVLLAFYGQTYQTGADPWQLFANWALLILPWVLVGRLAALWLLWVALINVAMLLYYHAMGSLFWILLESSETMLWMVFLVNAVVWLAWEVLATRFDWLAQRWAVRVVALASGSALSILMLYRVVDDYDKGVGVLFLYLAWIGVLYLVYRKHIRDLFMLAGLCLSVIVVLTTQLGKVMLDDDGFAFLLIALMVVGMAAAAANWLRKVHREMQV